MKGMRYMGIDFGKKRIGIALSDESGKMAFPRTVVPNDRRRMIEIREMIVSKGVEEIVLGESKDYGMQDNKIMKDILLFKKELEWETKLPIHMENELMTTAQAAQIQGEGALIDASAAAIILQSYIDKLNNK
jgi:putative Holliday junction resolvase